jgi:hypothetical protein
LAAAKPKGKAMAELKLEPGWLTRDVTLAAQRTNDWFADQARRQELKTENQQSMREDNRDREPKL